METVAFFAYMVYSSLIYSCGQSDCMNVGRERHLINKNEHCVLQMHWQQRKAMKRR